MVKLICYNVEYCEGIQGKWYQYLDISKVFSAPRKLEYRLVNQLKRLQPDILALVEVDTGSIRSHFSDEVEFIAKRTGLKNFIEKVKYPVTGWLSLYHHIPILDKQANAIISKYQLKNVKYHVLHEGTKRMVIEATIQHKKPVTLLLAHLALGKNTRAEQIEELKNIVNEIKNPVILMGDFNTFNGEEEIQSLLDDTHLDDKMCLDKTDAHFTVPSIAPVHRLDYILTSPQIKVNQYKILQFKFSDHLPLMVDFDVR
jgi:endonuclease/exonuclease/phosphatase family metal-dependent hydrolase